MTHRLLAAGLVLAFALTSRGDGAQPSDAIVTRLGGQALLAVLQQEGFTPALTKDGQGDPKIVFKVEGVKCAIFFYNCEGGQCRSIKYAAGFAMKKKPSCAAVNTWNRERRFGRAFLDDEQDPHLQMDLDLDGGVTQAHLVESLSTWRAILPAFADAIASE
jgi:hypothetical protein